MDLAKTDMASRILSVSATVCMYALAIININVVLYMIVRTSVALYTCHKDYIYDCALFLIVVCLCLATAVR